MTIDRYRAIIPDWDRFVETVRRPEPVTIRVREGRLSRDELARRLAAQGFVTEPVDGLPRFLRVTDGPRAVAHTLEHWLGLFYQQQSVTGVAAPLLAPRPGERILDMCASPGGKTTHLAELMGERGCLVASDVSEGRLKGLMGNLTRLLLPNVVAVVADGRQFPAGARFDRVLVDAPCSAEGNLRKKRGRFRDQKPSFLRHVTQLQEGILRRAVDLVRPGGPVLYVTCTFSPDENEAVLTRVLADAPVRMRPLTLPVPSSPGVTAFEGQRFHPDVELAHRIYPHHMDSGGLFIAMLERTGGREAGGAAGLDAGDATETATPLPGWTPVPPVYPDDGTDPAEAAAWMAAGLERLVAEFGVDPADLDRFGWMYRADSGWMHTCDAWPVEGWEPGDWRVSSVGLRALSPDARGDARPTNYLLRLLTTGGRRIDLDSDGLARLLRKEPVPAPGLEPGYASLTLDGQVIGRGSVGRAGVRHEIPKGRANELLRMLEVRAGSGA